tara:strand:+ start:102 stop:296 length:195 start_codon:yes stop_codon:yes gene_type:complete
MTKYIFKSNGLTFNSQAELAFALDLNKITVRSKFHRAGGKDNIKSIEISGHTIEIIKTEVPKLV